MHSAFVDYGNKSIKKTKACIFFYNTQTRLEGRCCDAVACNATITAGASAGPRYSAKVPKKAEDCPTTQAPADPDEVPGSWLRLCPVFSHWIEELSVTAFQIHEQK